jgi:predicted dinucleotide-binding enzyme
MKGEMKIGIIGTGQIGSVLTRHFTRLGHDVAVANARGPETLGDLARETGAKPLQASEVPGGRDLVVVTIPEGKIPELPRDLFFIRTAVEVSAVSTRHRFCKGPQRKCHAGRFYFLSGK